jgi:hypothetical protein
MGKQRVPCPSLLGQRNSEMSHVLTSDGARNEAVTADGDITNDQKHKKELEETAAISHNTANQLFFLRGLAILNLSLYFKK